MRVVRPAGLLAQWSFNSNGTITSVMDGQCLQISNGGSVSTAPCVTGHQPAPTAPAYVRLPQKQSCGNGTALVSKAQCSSAFNALRSTLPAGAKDNTRCCDGGNLPYGCTYREDNDFVYNSDRASTSTYSAGGWRAVCASAPASQHFVVNAVGGEVTIKAGSLCVDNDT